MRRSSFFLGRRDIGTPHINGQRAVSYRVRTVIAWPVCGTAACRESRLPGTRTAGTIASCRSTVLCSAFVRVIWNRENKININYAVEREYLTMALTAKYRTNLVAHRLGQDGQREFCTVPRGCTPSGRVRRGFVSPPTICPPLCATNRTTGMVRIVGYAIGMFLVKETIISIGVYSVAGTSTTLLLLNKHPNVGNIILILKI